VSGGIGRSHSSLITAPLGTLETREYRRFDFPVTRPSVDLSPRGEMDK
jgi:hypothetical protein